MKIFNKVIGVLVGASLLFGCAEDYLETMPTDAVSGDEVFNTTDGALVALNGTYRRMWTSTTHGQFGQKSTDLTFDLMGEDMVVHSQGYGWFNAEYNFSQTVNPGNGTRSDYLWSYNYIIANNASRLIANTPDAVGPQDDKDYIIGQGHVLRAYSYFYLANSFQQNVTIDPSAPGVPIYREPTSEGASRAPLSEVYAFINEDLDRGIALLEGKDRRHISHATAAVARGLKARVALQAGDYPAAAQYANAARQGLGLMNPDQYNAGFSKYNPEWMWGLEIIDDQATIFASFFSHLDPIILSYASLGGQKKINTNLYSYMSDTDARKANFITPGTGAGTTPDYASIKFVVANPGSWDADYLLMRASEMYLIEAEALARTGQDGPAADLLNELVSARDAAYSFSGAGQALIDEILIQRRIELWGEGFRYLDIKRLDLGLDRTGTIHNPALAQIMELPARDNMWIFRIPLREIDANDNIGMSDQN
ncbi:RagB/SusD family nutrient uptake outer membrane protein [Litoribacter populi]|uniref:RagB/SusD family nutrient uptake outer membrane protein n=1 Tax=Litoribacter populi TaxID=2598460 RepID=UPI00117BEF95|nr:RagB/SusD family nutrient uptake outer membrane protein [Litoribacter populi]